MSAADEALIIPPGMERYTAQHRSHGDYAETCVADVRQIEGWLSPGSVLDIGCGLGGPSVLMQRICGGKLYLLDGTGWSRRRVGFGRESAPFNDMGATLDLMRANDVWDYDVLIAGTMKFPLVRNVVSLLAWGWHFPVETYLEAAAAALLPAGRLIIDLRAGHGGELALSQYFRLMYSEPLQGKGARTAWQLH